MEWIQRTNGRSVIFTVGTPNEREAWERITDFLGSTYEDNPQDYEEENGIPGLVAEILSDRIKAEIKREKRVSLQGYEVELLRCATEYLRDEFDTDDDWRYAIDAKDRGEVTKQRNIQAVIANIHKQAEV